MAEIDRLELAVEVEASKANTQLDKLVSKLESVSSVLSGINIGGFKGISQEVEKLSSSIKSMSGIKTTDFNRLTKNLNKIADVDFKNLDKMKSPLKNVSESISDAASQIGVAGGKIKEEIDSISNNGTATTKSIGVEYSVPGSMSDLTKEVDRAEKKLDSLLTKERRLSFQDIGENTGQWKGLQFDIEETCNYLDALYNKQKEVSSIDPLANTTFQSHLFPDKTFDSTGFSEALKQLDIEAQNIGSEELPVTKSFRELESTALSTSNGIRESIGKTDQATSMWGNTIDLIKQSFDNLGNGSTLDALKTSMSSFKEKVQLTSGSKVYSDDYIQLKNDIDKTNNSLADLEAKQERMKATGVKASSQSWKGLQYDIKSAKDQLYTYESSMANLTHSGGAVVSSHQGMKGAIADFAATINMGKNAILQSAQSTPVLGTALKGISGTARIAKTAISGLINVASKIGSGFKKVGSVLSSIGSKLKGLVPGFNRTKGAMNGMSKSTNPLSKGLFKVANMLKLMITRMALRAVVNGAKEGFQNLAQYSEKTNKSLSMLMSSLTQLKNSFAVAFTPILDVVAPILSTLINYISAAMNSIGQLFAALSGQSTYTIATSVNEDYAASLNGAASSANDATDAAEEYKKSLMGFDQINKLDDSSSSSDSGSNSGTNVNDMFDTASVSNQFSDLANKIKEAWKNADFTEIGEMVGSKINEALSSINWTKIQATLDKIAKSVATFLNGFISSTDWELVGGTLAQGINTIFRTANTFAVNFDWSSLGNALGNGINGALNGLDWAAIKTSVSNVVGGITSGLNSFMRTTDWSLVGKTLAEGINTIIEGAYIFVTTFDWGELGNSLASGINGLVSNIDWSKAGKTLSDGIKGIIKFLKTAISETDWGQIGKSIGKFLAAIDWKGIFKELAGLIAEAINGIFEFISGVFDDNKLLGFMVTAIGTITAALATYSVVSGIVTTAVAALGAAFTFLITHVGIAVAAIAAIIAVGVLLYKNWNEVCAWCKETWGAIKETISNVVDAIKDFFKGLWDKICEIFGSIGDWFGEKFTAARDAVTGAFESIGDWFGEKYKAVKNAFVNVGDWFSDKFKTAYSNVKTAFNGIGDWASTSYTSVKNGFSSVGDWFSEKFGGAWSNVKTAFSSDNAGTYFSGVLTNIKDNFGGISDWFGTTFSKAWTAVKDVFSSGGAIFDGIKDGILDGLKSVINALISGINSVISVPFSGINNALGNIKRVSIMGVKPFSWISTISTPQIPKLATGGVVNTGQLFVANEAGPELVGNFGGKTGVMNNNQIVESVTRGVYNAVISALSQSQAQQGSQMPDIAVYVGGEKVTDVVIKGIKKITKSTGVNPVTE